MRSSASTSKRAYSIFRPLRVGAHEAPKVLLSGPSLLRRLLLEGTERFKLTLSVKDLFHEAVALAACPAERVKLADQFRNLGRVEKGRNFMGDRTPWYLRDGHGALTSVAQTPGCLRIAGSSFYLIRRGYAPPRLSGKAKDSERQRRSGEQATSVGFARYAGSMFWLRWKRLSGSYVRLICASRS